MKKYKIAVGICGPTILYSNIIKAQSPEEAVEKYIAESDGLYSEADKGTLLNHIHEIGSSKVKKDKGSVTSMKDCILNALKVGDSVAFLCAETGDRVYRKYHIQKGTIQSFSSSSAVIECSDLGQTFRILGTTEVSARNKKNICRLMKVALLSEFTPANDNTPSRDALGQELKIGDTVVFMDDSHQSSGVSLVCSTVTKMTAKFAEMDGFRKKTYDKVVRLKSSN